MGVTVIKSTYDCLSVRLIEVTVYRSFIPHLTVCSAPNSTPKGPKHQFRKELLYIGFRYALCLDPYDFMAKDGNSQIPERWQHFSGIWINLLDQELKTL